MDNISHVHRLRVVNFDSSGTAAAVKSQASNSINKKGHDENPTFKIEVEKSRPGNRINDHSLKIKDKPMENITKPGDQKIHHRHKRREDRAEAKPKLSSKIPKYTTKTGKVKFGGVKTQGALSGKKNGSIRSYSKHKRKSDVNELKLLFLRGTTLLSSLHNFSKDVLKSKNKSTKKKLEVKPKSKKEKTKEVNILFSRKKEKHKKLKKTANRTKRLQSFDDIFGFRKSNAFFNYQSSCSRISFCRRKIRQNVQCPIKRSYSCENQASNVNIKCVRTNYSKNNSDPCALHSVNIMQFPLERKEAHLECTLLNTKKPSICIAPLKIERQSNICCSGGSGDASQICTQAEPTTDKQCPPCLESFMNDPCPPNHDWSGPDTVCRSKPKLCVHPIVTPCYGNERKQESGGKKCLKYILLVMVVLSWAPCIFVVVLCWLITYPLRPHWIRSQKYKSQCYNGESHRLQRYRCNQCRIPLGFWSSFINWIKDFKWTNTSPYEALAAMLRGDRCTVKRKVVPNPEKQYALYHTSSRGWVMKPMQSKNIQRHYNCTINPCYPQKPTCDIEIKEPCPTKKKRRKKNRSKICIPVEKCTNPNDPCRACLNLLSNHDLPAKTFSDYKVCIDPKPPCPVYKKQSKPCAYDPYTGTLTSPCVERPPCTPCLPKPVCKISIAPCPQRKNLLKKYLLHCRKCITKSVACGADPCTISPSCTITRKTPCANKPCSNLPFSNVCHRHPCDFGKFDGCAIPRSLPGPNILGPLLPPFCNLQTPLGFGNFNRAGNQGAPFHGQCNRDQQRSEQCKICNPVEEPLCGQHFRKQCKICNPVEEPVCDQHRRELCKICNPVEEPLCGQHLRKQCKICNPVEEPVCGQHRRELCKICNPVEDFLCSQPRRVCGNLEQPRTDQPTFKKRCWRSVCYCVKTADRHFQEAHCRCYPKPQEPKSWVYKCCPTMYPMYQIWTQCTTGCCHLCLYIISACVWCPPILCCYMCYELLCTCS